MRFFLFLFFYASQTMPLWIWKRVEDECRPQSCHPTLEPKSNTGLVRLSCCIMVWPWNYCSKIHWDHHTRCLWDGWGWLHLAYFDSLSSAYTVVLWHINCGSHDECGHYRWCQSDNNRPSLVNKFQFLLFFLAHTVYMQNKKKIIEKPQ